MSTHTPTWRRVASTAIAATALTVPLMLALPAQAAPCKTRGKHANCNKVVHTPGTGGGGTDAGGGGNSGPWVPPPPEGLTPDEAQGVIGVPGVVPPAPAPPATADLLAMAQAATVFPTPIVHTAPKGKTYVRLRTSLWVDGFRDVQTEPITIGAQTVQLIARPASVTWNMDEKTFDCADAGSKQGKTCHYTYRKSSTSKPGGRYMITATINWNVKWTCVGDDCDSGGAPLPPNPVQSEATPLVVSEIQTNTGQ